MERAKESSFGFSWADEVEREEEERENENQIRIQRKREREIGENINKRSDPFGAARPREVILEEKGVDWKILDQDFNFDSSIRECKTKKIPQKKPLNIQNSQTIFPCQKTVPCEELVPPLKYPPKNINSVFKNIHQACKLKPDKFQKFKTNDQCDGNKILMGSNAKRASMNSSNGLAYARAHRVSKLSTNQNTSLNLNRVLVDCNNKKVASGSVVKEKTGSNFEAKSVKENGMKEEAQVDVERRVLVELNRNNSSCKKVPWSNNYFSVLELLEPSSQEKSNSGKQISDRSARKRIAVPASEDLENNFEVELEAGKKNRDKPTKRGKRSNK